MRQQTQFATLFFVLITLSLSANRGDQYISTYQDIAQREMNRSGIPASIIIAQGILESSWGNGDIAVRANNHFGIKCKDYWTGPTYYHKDDDYENGQLIKSCFRAYENVESSYFDHTNFLMDTERYRRLFSFDKTDYKSWAKGLKECGYATDPSYAEKLIKIIEENQLYKYDIIQDPVLEAPLYYIPQQFLNKQESEDPAIYVYEESNVASPQSQQQTEQIPAIDFEESQEDSYAQVEESAVSKVETSYSQINKIRDATYRPHRYEMTGIIPNNSSKDKRIQNLTRKPRVSGSVGPR